MAVVKVSWSGGKDSTASVLLHLKRGDKVIAVCYVPMFTDDIPFILRSHYNFILRAKKKLERMGATVILVKGMTYYDYCMKTITRGENKGKLMGFPAPITGMCGFKNYSKEKALNNVSLGKYDYEDIGIAADEVKRQNQLTENKRSILVELGKSEAYALKLCRHYNLLSPMYEEGTRDGCALCPNGDRKRRQEWFSENPEAFDIVKDMQRKIAKSFPKRAFGLRDQKMFIENNKIN